MIRPTPPPTFPHPDSGNYFFLKASRLTTSAPALSWRGASSAGICSAAAGMSVLDADCAGASGGVSAAGVRAPLGTRAGPDAAAVAEEERFSPLGLRGTRGFLGVDVR